MCIRSQVLGVSVYTPRLPRTSSRENELMKSESTVIIKRCA